MHSDTDLSLSLCFRRLCVGLGYQKGIVVFLLVCQLHALLLLQHMQRGYKCVGVLQFPLQLSLQQCAYVIAWHPPNTCVRSQGLGAPTGGFVLALGTFLSVSDGLLAHVPLLLQYAQGGHSAWQLQHRYNTSMQTMI